mgnify:CR=1 FL=1
MTMQKNILFSSIRAMEEIAGSANSFTRNADGEVCRYSKMLSLIHYFLSTALSSGVAI